MYVVDYALRKELQHGSDATHIHTHTHTHTTHSTHTTHTGTNPPRSSAPDARYA
jgi:hypothetical protein